MQKQVRRPGRWRKYLFGLAGLLLAGVAAAAVVTHQTNQYAEGPGPVAPAKRSVLVAGKADHEPGGYYLTSVRVQGPLTVGQVLAARLRPYTTVYAQSAARFGDQQQRDYAAVKMAADSALQAALKLAKRRYTVDYVGLYVLTIAKGSPFAPLLKVGDTITLVDGKHYASAQQYLKAIRAHRPGTTMTIGGQRGTRPPFSGAVKITRSLAGSGLGLTYGDNTSTGTVPAAAVTPRAIGPSYGLMYAVQLYTQITGRHLRQGQKIAGTGTIDPQGNVGLIGGIDKKVYAASRAGMKVFFAPDIAPSQQLLKRSPGFENNYVVARRTAKAIHTAMKIVPVKTLRGAIAYLQRR
ncbi:SepM family pheromone-processing serine protease [Lacticaseibacillus jixianensis]|uniref:SepM family pheromone-processing serine protease n=1 Tax=Lacticaseibacillus jixianensis TaxID=2486012 RepID=A0ABW4BA59_9LACO|nr:SepM family pheromone-processing serine protease [Lacticaseibacillus jixianensis]